MAKRFLSLQAYNKYLGKLTAKECLTKNEIMGLTRALNHKMSDSQAEALLYEAQNVPTERGLLLHFEYKSGFLDSKWVPIFASKC